MSYIRLMVLCLLMTNVQANNLYLDKVNMAVIDAESLQKSKDKINKHKNITVKDDLEVIPFHKRQAWQQTSLKLTFCTDCHLQPPHTKNIRSRVFLNMHTEFIACESCHFRPDNTELTFQWFDYQTQHVVTPKSQLFRQTNGDSTEQQASNNTSKLIKISPFWQDKPTLILNSHPFALKTADLWKTADLATKAEQRAKIHQPLKEKGRKCQACHQTDNPILDLAALGATPQQIKAIQQHIIPQFFKRYTKDEQHIRLNNLLK